MNKTCILVTGQIFDGYFYKLIEQYKDIEYKIASIWENERAEYIETLKKNNFLVVLNKISDQAFSVPQFIPIVNGLSFCQKNNFEFVLRTRFDILSRDYLKYLENTKHLYKDKISVISGIHTSNIYFVDFIVVGKTNEMCKFYNLQMLGDKRFIEQFCIEKYSGKNNLTREDIRKIFHFTLPVCKENNIEYFFHRPGGGWINSFLTAPDMKVISDYCTHPFIWI